MALQVLQVISRKNTKNAERQDQIYRVKVKPHDQVRLLLGDFAKDEIPKGFCVEVATNREHEDSIASEVVPMSKGGKTRLFMHVANYGPVPLPVTVSRL